MNRRTLKTSGGRIFSSLFLTLILTSPALAQEVKTPVPVIDYQFTVINQVKSTPPLSQGSTGTCWSFATTSMLESEIMRLGGPETHLSEMFTVRNIYAEKAMNYVRFHGTVNFAEGGEQHDVLTSFRKYGMVPQEIYPGLNYGEENHKHGEIITVLKAVVDNVIKNRNGKLSPVWLTGFNGVLDAYFGRVPKTFIVNEKTFTPVQYAASLGINPDDYVEFTSFTHHPFYKKFVLEIPDNWDQKYLYNVPIDELMAMVDYALSKNISISWGADISGLNFHEGVGTIPEEGSDVKDPQHKKLTINQEDRQNHFDTYQLTDDHVMHLIGTAKDQFGKKYFIEKNSWGEGGKFNGFSYMSESFMRLRTISIMVHKDGVPEEIMHKLGGK